MKNESEPNSSSSQSSTSEPKPSIQQSTTLSQSASLTQPTTSSANANVLKKPANLPNEFENYLKNLKNPRALPFDIKRFKTCSDADRKQCANKFLKFALNEPTQAKELVQLAYSTRTLNMINKKTFINFLSENCEEKLKKFQKNNEVVDWVEMEAFGVILGELYNLEVIKIYLMNTYLNNTKLMADVNDLALKILFKVVQIIHNKMVTKDKKTLTTFLKYFEEYKNAKRVPVAYANWLQNVLRVQASQRGDKSRSPSAVSTSSQISQASSQQQSEPSSSTGAIRKQT